MDQTVTCENNSLVSPLYLELAELAVNAHLTRFADASLAQVTEWFKSLVYFISSFQ